jgi:gliding motility-associated protein GldL
VVLATLKEKLENAEISPDLFMRLGIGMRKLSETTANINAMGDISVASAKYANTINSANDSLSRLNDSYQTATKVINETRLTYHNMSDSVSTIETAGKSFQQQLDIINKNLSALNTVYELQRQSADNFMKQTDALHKDMNELMKDLTSSAGNSKLYSEQILKLNDNLSALNSVYGNMLAAMNLKKY